MMLTFVYQEVACLYGTPFPAYRGPKDDPATLLFGHLLGKPSELHRLLLTLTGMELEAFG